MSLSREFAGFVAGLKYEDLPGAVADRAKGAVSVRVKVTIPRELVGKHLLPERSALVEFRKPT